MPDAPSGVCTFLFSDLEGSTRLWESFPESMTAALAWHDELAARTVATREGTVVKLTGDGFCAVFATAAAAIAAAVAFREELRKRVWPEIGRLRARVGLHAGTAERRGGDYFGRTVNRCARLMAAAHGGQVVCTESVADLVKESELAHLVFVDLGRHRLKDLASVEHVYEVRTPDDPDEFPPLRSMGTGRTNLPTSRTTFIGRDREIATLRALLPMTRIVTLAGPGGVGKTRLALATAADLLPAYSDGVFVAELAAVSAGDLIAGTIAAAVGMPLTEPRRDGSPASDILDDLVRYLHEQRTLLVIDNCEHVLAGCAFVIDHLVRECPMLTVLATSREILAIEGEHVWRVPPLSLPALDTTSTDGVGSSEAVRLFVERAHAANPAFVLDDAAAGIVAEICRRLDGIPLAIELAACRARHLSASQIRDRLDERFRLLTGGARTSPPRHQTLAATMDWSHELLTPSEQIVLRRLAVFCGDFSLAAAEAVCPDDTVDARSMLDLMGSLVDKSLLVVVEQGAEARYRMLETVRQYAERKLLDAHETEIVRDRHLHWFVDLADAVTLRPWGSLIFRSLVELRSSAADLTAALEHARCSDRTMPLADRMLARIWGCWLLTGRWDHARPLLGAASERTGVAPLDRLSLLLGLATIGVLTGDFRSVAAYCVRLSALASEANEAAVLPVVLMRQAVASQVTGEGDARVLLAEAVEQARAVGDGYAAAEALADLGEVHLVQGDPASAGRLIDQALAALDDATPAARSIRMYCLSSRCMAAHLADDHATAVRAGIDAVRSLERGDTHWGGVIATAYAAVGLAFAADGDWESAAIHQSESMRLLGRLRHPLADADCLVACAGALFLRGEVRRAGCLLGAARAIMGANGAWRHPTGGALYLHYVRRVRDTLAPEIAERARSEGRAMSRDAAIAYALASLGDFAARSSMLDG